MNRTPRVETIFVAPEDSAPMEPLDSVEAVEGGLTGDRYLTGKGYYSPFDVCEVTFIEREAIETIHEEFGIDLSDGRHRRNVVTRGVDLHDLLETTFRVGDVEFRGTRPRPPCAHIEEVADEENVMRALKERRGGICADVVTGGELRVGDEIEVIEDAPRDVGRSIADRLRRKSGQSH